jgi:hypothetical protein
VNYQLNDRVIFKATILKENYEYGHDGDIDESFD